MTSQEDILQAESDLVEAQKAYVRSFGWRETCHTPGAYWLWVRDFADIDERMTRIAIERDLPTKHKPYGVMTVPLDLAVSMTVRALDEGDPEEEIE